MSAMTPAAGASSSGEQRPFLRPVPRRRPAAFLLRPVDIAWLAILAAVSGALSFYLQGSTAAQPVETAPFPLPHAAASLIGIASLALASAGVYLTGLRFKDRAAAIISGLLVATSLALVCGAAWSPGALLMSAIVCFSIFSYAMDWTVAAFVLAGIAALVRADAMSLGAVLAIVALCQRRPYVWVGIVAFLLLAALAGGLWFVPWHNSLELWLSPASTRPDRLLLFASLSPVAWFLFPYLAEWGSAQDRAKWWAPTLWLLGYIALSAHMHGSSDPASYLPLLPIASLMAGAGIARLLPAFAGELAIPLARYLVAAAAVAALLAARLAMEWQALHGWLLLAPASPK